MALSANRNLSIRNTAGMRKVTCTVATGATVYKHALVALKEAGTTCLPAANDTTTTFLGLSDAQHTAVTTGVFYTNMEVSIPFTTGVTAGHRDSLAYCTDDEKVTYDSTLGPPCGVFQEIDSSDATKIWVLLGVPTAPGSAS